MAIIAIGDIHGNLVALNDLLSQILSQVSKSDSIVFLGDYIDRGPNACGCIDRNAVLDSNGWPSPIIMSNGTYGIDTISHGILTAIRLPDERIFQSGQYL